MMSNCYDHSIKKDMMDSYSWNSKEEAKANVLQNYKQLRQWYEDECKKYKRPLGGDESFNQWYEEYTGGTWEENNE
tara:strand:- start:264 stop:491 length:228 start_codon:yes stop_codon:yes gene_type:complete